MVIDIESRVIVGYTYEELESWLETKATEGLWDEERYQNERDWLYDELASLSPWYDAEREYCKFGVSVGIGHGEAVKITDEIISQIQEVSHTLFQKYGMWPEIYAGANVW